MQTSEQSVRLHASRHRWPRRAGSFFFFEGGAEGHTNLRVHIFICVAALLFLPPPPALLNEIRLLSDLCHTPSLFPQITEFYHEKIKRPHGFVSSPQEAVDNLLLCCCCCFFQARFAQTVEEMFGFWMDHDVSVSKAI